MSAGRTVAGGDVTAGRTVAGGDVTAGRTAAGDGPVEEPIFGDRFDVEVGPVAHGGHCVARAPDGRVVFVRHALPGERVTVSVTEVLAGYLRADAVEVLRASPDRVASPCRFAGPAAGCGGCDFQHVAPAAQRRLKAEVVAEQLIRLGGLSPDQVAALGIRVAELPGGMLGWRSRVQYAVDATGRAGLLAHRSHEVVPVDRCLIAHPAVAAAAVTATPWPHDDRVEVVAAGAEADATATGASTAAGSATVIGSSSGVVAGAPWVRRQAAGRGWELPYDAFWQVHPAAADALVAGVLDLLEPADGERAWDLYGGAGLFAAALAGRGVTVTLVESDPAAAAGARASLGDLPGIRIVLSTVERFGTQSRPDLVVLDPPRTGAGRAVVRRVTGAGPRAVAYVACDPAPFARDVATFRANGYTLAALRAFDAFPMTHHVECVGLLVPA